MALSPEDSRKADQYQPWGTEDDYQTREVTSACAARVELRQGDSWQSAIAILPDTRMAAVQWFVLCQTGEIINNVWKYDLRPWDGCFTIPPESLVQSDN